MKRFLNKIIFFFILLIPLFVSAKELEDAGINNYFINAVVVENGDIIVEEYFELMGEYDGYIRDINYRVPSLYTFRPELEWYGPSNIMNGNDVYLLDIKAVNKDKNFTFENVTGTSFEKTSFGEEGDYGVYEVEYGLSGNSYKIYLPSSKNKAFYMKYRLKNMGAVYNDVAEVYWSVPILDIYDDINNLKVSLSLKSESELFRVWSHGPIESFVEPINNKTLLFNVKNLSIYDSDIELRMVFDRSYLSKSFKKYDTMAFEKILAYEEVEQNQISYDKKQEDFLNLEKAKNYYDMCDSDPDMSCYNTLVEKINGLLMSKEKDELMSYLPALREKAMKTEMIRAEHDMEDAVYYLDYEHYEEALEQVNILDDSEIKYEYLEKLAEIREIIYEDEYETNVILLLFNIVVGLVLLILICLLAFERKYSYKSKFNQPYYRDLPKLSPTDISYLINNRKISNDAVSSELLLLITKKYMSVEKVDKKDYIFTKLIDEKELKSVKEKKLLDFLFNGKDTVKLSEFKKNSKKNPYNFSDRWSFFNSVCVNNAKHKGLYVQEEFTYSFGNLFALLGIVLLLFPIFFIAYPVAALVLFVIFIIEICRFKDKFKIVRSLLNFISFIFLIVMFAMIITAVYYSNFVRFGLISWFVVFILFIIFYLCAFNRDPYTDKGKETYGKIMAFKRFLNHFSTMDEKDLPDIKLWEQYLAYAVVLDCADKVENIMKVKYDLQEVKATGYSVLTDVTFRSSVRRSFRSSVTRARSYSDRRIRSTRRSRSSSSRFYGSTGGFGGRSSRSGSIGRFGSFGGGRRF